MSSTLFFSKLQKEDIFCQDFNEFERNNEITFSSQGIAVLYAPNGTGKTSLVKILSNSDNCIFNVSYNGQQYDTSSNNLFHIINDQNSRNIIAGTTKDFLLGDNIKKEFDLKSYIDKEYGSILAGLIDKLKNNFNISKKTSPLIDKVENTYLKKYIRDLANSQSKGKEIEQEDFVNKIDCLDVHEILYDEEKLNYLIRNCNDKKSFILKILEIDSDKIKKEEAVQQIEENDEAIKILKKFDYKDECVVCDSQIEREKLLDNKEENRRKVYEALDAKTKEILEKIIGGLAAGDPFNIKAILLDAIKIGNKAVVYDLQKDIENYFEVFNNELNKMFSQCCKQGDIITKIKEYKEILQNKPIMDGEDIRLIQDIVNENIDKKIELQRDENDNLKLFIGDKELINCGRDELHLSSGEQNFISLAFEVLKAKKTDKIIILDDPISSFDSIYKNKITFILIKFLENREQIILTHNLDLVKLMEHQQPKSFNLYLLNNTLDEENGFIRVNSAEQNILLYLNELLGLFRGDIISVIEDKQNFLVSMVPFMRGYTQIIDSEEKNNLTQLMHGFNSEKMDLNNIYKNLFKIDLGIKLEVSADDITNMDISNIKILKQDSYPLLNKTLYHTLTYLYLRLNVEKILVKKYSINTNKYDQLGRIIGAAFRGNDSNNISNRIFLNSKKTLLNEFNHFEGNMNIFQPAIDITDTALKKEKESILEFLSKL